MKEPLLQLLAGALGEPHVWLALPGPARESEDFAGLAVLVEVLRNRDAGSSQQADTTVGMGIEVDGQFPGFHCWR